MIEKYPHIDPDLAQRLIDRAKTMQWSKRGIDRRAFLLGEYAVLATDRLKTRNVITRDDDLAYFDQIAAALSDLHRQGVAVVPILGYCCDENSPNGTGYIIQMCAKGAEMYDDAVIFRFQAWAQKNKESIYLQNGMSDEQSARYLVDRTCEISQAPQEHFDKFIRDMRSILECDLLIDCMGKSNFFYDKQCGFQFIDLDSHNDYTYGLEEQKPDNERLLSICGFVPCHYAAGTQFFAPNALDECALLALSDAQRERLADANRIIFAKCLSALRNIGIWEPVLQRTLDRLRIYGA